MTEFEMSVWNIEGVTAFELNKLPDWFGERLDYISGAFENGRLTDEELIDQYVRSLFAKTYQFGAWGCATFGDEQVVVLEQFDLDGVFEEIRHLIALMEFGFEVAEFDGNDGWVTFLTEKRRFIRRKPATEAMPLVGALS
jgi:hypothetical protein